eukprot:Rhum_TRINITY_DN15354_c6_g1::Rhum_TRINITY_DN15354_c6_g1_i1::g.154029::m.154029
MCAVAGRAFNLMELVQHIPDVAGQLGEIDVVLPLSLLRGGLLLLLLARRRRRRRSRGVRAERRAVVLHRPGAAGAVRHAAAGGPAAQLLERSPPPLLVALLRRLALLLARPAVRRLLARPLPLRDLVELPLLLLLRQHLRRRLLRLSGRRRRRLLPVPLRLAHLCEEGCGPAGHAAAFRGGVVAVRVVAVALQLAHAGLPAAHDGEQLQVEVCVSPHLHARHPRCPPRVERGHRQQRRRLRAGERRRLLRLVEQRRQPARHALRLRQRRRVRPARRTDGAGGGCRRRTALLAGVGGAGLLDLDVLQQRAHRGRVAVRGLVEARQHLGEPPGRRRHRLVVAARRVVRRPKALQGVRAAERVRRRQRAARGGGEVALARRGVRPGERAHRALEHLLAVRRLQDGRHVVELRAAHLVEQHDHVRVLHEERRELLEAALPADVAAAALVHRRRRRAHNPARLLPERHHRARDARLLRRRRRRRGRRLLRRRLLAARYGHRRQRLSSRRAPPCAVGFVCVQVVCADLRHGDDGGHACGQQLPLRPLRQPAHAQRPGEARLLAP